MKKLITQTKALILFILCLLLSGCSMFGVNNVEEPDFSVLDKQGKFEIRRYEGLIVAQTQVAGEDREEVGGVAFKRLFGYISGRNQGQASIEMAAPVLSEASSKRQGQKIQMTAPVLSERTELSWQYAFVLPKKYTLDSAPVPIAPEITIVEMTPATYAVIGFTGNWSEWLFKEKSAELLEFVAARDLTPISSPRIARYNPPWTLPALKRNEVMIEIE